MTEKTETLMSCRGCAGEYDDDQCRHPHSDKATCWHRINEQDNRRATGGETHKVSDYLHARRLTIEASIAAEVLAGNKYKEECERTALAEITTMECRIANGAITDEVCG